VSLRHWKPKEKLMFYIVKEKFFNLQINSRLNELLKGSKNIKWNKIHFNSFRSIFIIHLNYAQLQNEKYKNTKIAIFWFFSGFPLLFLFIWFQFICVWKAAMNFNGFQFISIFFLSHTQIHSFIHIARHEQKNNIIMSKQLIRFDLQNIYLSSLSFLFLCWEIDFYTLLFIFESNFQQQFLMSFCTHSMCIFFLLNEKVSSTHTQKV
jgi:hypothetical protein